MKQLAPKTTDQKKEMTIIMGNESKGHNYHQKQ